MGIYDLADTHKRDYLPHDALDELDGLLEKMSDMGIDHSRGFARWRDDMRAQELWDALLEMSLYVHCKAAGLDAALDPEIDGGRRADLLVDGCHIEAYAPPLAGLSPRQTAPYATLYQRYVTR